MPELEPEGNYYSCEDPEGLTELPDAGNAGELLGLPLAKYPVKTDDYPGVQVHPEERGGSISGIADYSLAVLLLEHQSMHYAQFPTDPVMEHSATLSPLGWYLVE